MMENVREISQEQQEMQLEFIYLSKLLERKISPLMCNMITFRKIEFMKKN